MALAACMTVCTASGAFFGGTTWPSPSTRRSPGFGPREASSRFRWVSSERTSASEGAREAEEEEDDAELCGAWSGGTAITTLGGGWGRGAAVPGAGAAGCCACRAAALERDRCVAPSISAQAPIMTAKTATSATTQGRIERRALTGVPIDRRGDRLKARQCATRGRKARQVA